MRSDIAPGATLPDYELPDDWDLDTPGLRDAWDAGKRSLFHGHDYVLASATPDDG